MVMITVDAVDEPPIFTVTSVEGAVGFSDEGKFAAVVSFDEVTGIDATTTAPDNRVAK